MSWNGCFRSLPNFCLMLGLSFRFSGLLTCDCASFPVVLYGNEGMNRWTFLSHAFIATPPHPPPLPFP